MMRVPRLVVAALVASAVGIASDGAHAQNYIGDVPDAFFGAQRGRVIAHAHGGYRMRYGRGLTAQGASVINTGITTIGPLLPAIIGAAPAATFVPGASYSPGIVVGFDSAAMAQANNAARSPAAAQGPCDCEERVGAAPDPVLDALANADEAGKHIQNLDCMLQRLKPVLARVGKPYYEPSAPAPTGVGPTTDGSPSTGGNPPAGGGSSGPPNVVGGGRINPTSALRGQAPANPCGNAAEPVPAAPSGDSQPNGVPSSQGGEQEP